MFEEDDRNHGEVQGNGEPAESTGVNFVMNGSQSRDGAEESRPAGGEGYPDYAGQTPGGQQSYGYQEQTSGGQPSYGYQEQTPGGQPPEPPRKTKKTSWVRKTAGIAASALLFGVIAGGTMAGINLLAGSAEKADGTAATAAASGEGVTLSDEEISRIVNDLNLKAGTTQNLDVSAIVEEAMPSVVAINNTMLYERNNLWWGSQTYEVPSSGSGIIIGQNEDELLIVTNNHVVENATELSVVFIDGQAIDATVKGTDEETDLAVVSVPLSSIPAETMGQISMAKLGDSDSMKVGQGVVAIGNALGYGQSVTVGYVSALNREVQTSDSRTRKLLQTDAAINPGNSGGALLNMKGEVIGINAAKYTDTEVEGMGYAIPISQAQDIINSLMVRRSGDKVEEGNEGYLGIQGVTVDDSMVQQLGIPEGVYVYKILDGGAASKSDLREKDVITQFDGQTIRTMASLQDLLKYYKVGETVDMVVQSLENGQYVERTVTITLEKQVNSD